jgi:hypothetical protein
MRVFGLVLLGDLLFAGEDLHDNLAEFIGQRGQGRSSPGYDPELTGDARIAQRHELQAALVDGIESAAGDEVSATPALTKATAV